MEGFEATNVVVPTLETYGIRPPGKFAALLLFPVIITAIGAVE